MASNVASPVANHWGSARPYKAPNGNFYWITFATITENPTCYKTTNPDSTWTRQDAAGEQSPTGIVTVYGISTCMRGNLIHVVWCFRSSSTPFYELWYCQFNTSTDTWTTGGPVGHVDFTHSGTNGENAIYASVTARSDGDIIIGYNSPTERVMGSEKWRVSYAVYEGTSWTLEVALDSGGDVHYGNCNCILGSSNVYTHFMWQRATEDADDPPIAYWDPNGSTALMVQGRSLNNTNNLSTTANFGNSTDDAMQGFSAMALTLETGTTWRGVTVGVDQDATDFRGRVVRWTESSNNIASTANAEFLNSTVRPDVDVSGRAAMMSCCYDSNDKLHVVFADTSGTTLYIVSSDDFGATWGTPEILESSISITEVPVCNAYTISGTEYVGYIYVDSLATAYHGKYSLATGTQFNQSVAGSATATGAIVKQAQPVLTGSSTATGALTRVSSFLRTVTGSLTATGALLKETALSFAGSSTWTGALASTKVAFQSLAGSLAATGTVARATTFAAAVSGSLTAPGALLKQAQATLAGSATATGALLKQAQITLTGSSTWTGFLDPVLDAAQQFNQAVGGSLTATGALLKQTNFSLDGAVSAAGAIVKQINFQLQGGGAAGTFTYVGGADEQRNDGAVQITHGLGASIQSGDLIVAFVHINNTTVITPDQSWDAELFDENPDPGTETARCAMYWKVATASEPATYTWTAGTVLSGVTLKVFRPSGGTLQVDLAALKALNASSINNIRSTAQNGRTAATDAVSIVAGGKDNRTNANDPVTGVTGTGYTGAIGNGQHQITGMAHKIGGGAEPAQVDITGTDTADISYTHIQHRIAAIRCAGIG